MSGHALLPLAAAVLAALPALPTQAATARPRPRGVRVFVATNGSDQWSGKLADPSARRTDGPFVSLGRARDAVRAARRRGQQGPFHVLVRGGTYFPREPLVLGPQDSGTEGRPVTYQAYPGEQDSPWYWVALLMAVAGALAIRRR